MVEQKMGRRNAKTLQKSQTFPSSPTHSSSSSDFEFAVDFTSPDESSGDFCPADDLFFKGKLLPLHISPRLSMVQTIILASSSSSSSDSTASRSSNESSFSADVNPSVAGDDELNRLKKGKFPIPRISPVLKQDNKTGSTVKQVQVFSKEVIRGCLKKVKPLFEKLSIREESPGKQSGRKVSSRSRSLSDSFLGNLVYPRRKMPATCPSSPKHHRRLLKSFSDVSSSMEEQQNAIQGAITHCKDSMKLHR